MISVKFKCICSAQLGQNVETIYHVETVCCAKYSTLIVEKSTCDGWCPQMINGIQLHLYPVISRYYLTLSCALFPSKWVTTVVVAIFKNKGSRQSSKYYRPISLVHMFYKWFDFVL